MFPNSTAGSSRAPRSGRSTCLISFATWIIDGWPARLDMSTIDTRREQMFPKLEPREIDRLRRFGDVRRYSAGEALFVTGEIAHGMVVLIKGSVRVTRRDPL